MPADYALLIIRVAVGLVLLAHGVKHARGKEKTTAWFDSIGFRQPGLQWFASSASEIAVGLLLVVGLLTPFAAAGLIAIMVVAYFSVHRPAGFWVTARPDEGWEYVFVVAASGFAIAVGGSGSVAIDSWIGIADNLDGWIGFGIAVLGVVAALAQLATFFRPSEAVGDTDEQTSAQGAFPQS